MKRLAPTLQGFAVNDFDGTLDMNAYRAELRALLAVARAARGECGCGPGDNCPMQRALARLDKVSK